MTIVVSEVFSCKPGGQT